MLKKMINSKICNNISLLIKDFSIQKKAKIQSEFFFLVNKFILVSKKIFLVKKEMEAQFFSENHCLN